MTYNKLINGIEVCICEDSDQAADWVANHFVKTISQNPSCVLGLATGGTPVQTYQRLVQHNQQKRVDFSRVTTFNLDEYIGLDGQHPQSYRHFMNGQLFDHINIDVARTHVPDGCAIDVEKCCAEYEAMIVDAGGVDLQLLGLGHNGHIAFNEPGSTADSRTREVDLTSETISKNSRYFDSIDQVPKTAITMGIATILEAREIVLLATGNGKSDAVEKALMGEVGSHHPASFLQHHPNVVFVLDRPAAQNLSLADL